MTNSTRTRRRGKTAGLPTNDGSFKAEERAESDVTLADPNDWAAQADPWAVAQPIIDQELEVEQDLVADVRGIPGGREAVEEMRDDITQAVVEFNDSGDTDALAERIESISNEHLPRIERAIKDNADAGWWEENRARIGAMIGGYGPRMHAHSYELRMLKQAAREDAEDAMQGLGLNVGLPRGGMGGGRGRGMRGPGQGRGMRSRLGGMFGHRSKQSCPHCGASGRWDNRTNSFNCYEHCAESEAEREAGLDAHEAAQEAAAQTIDHTEHATEATR